MILYCNNHQKKLWVEPCKAKYNLNGKIMKSQWRLSHLAKLKPDDRKYAYIPMQFCL